MLHKKNTRRSKLHFSGEKEKPGGSTIEEHRQDAALKQAEIQEDNKGEKRSP